MSPVNAKQTQPKKQANGARRTKGNNKPRKKSSNSQNNQPQSTPVAYAVSFRQAEPKIRSTEKFTRIIHREPLCIIPQTGTPFTVQHFLALNPGIASTFRWLSTQALGWEKYLFEKLEFEYYTRVPTSNGGAILMAVDHDAADAAPSSEDAMMNYSGAVEDSIWVKALTCRAQCDNTKRFIRTAPLASNLDIKTYDLGNFIAATSGTGVSSANAGKVYVNYVVKLFIPQLITIPPSSVGGTIGSGGTVAPGNPFGSVPVNSANAVGYAVDSSSRITFDRIGQYLISSTAFGTGLNLPNPTIFSGGGSVTDAGNIINAAGTTGVLKAVFNVTNPPAVFDFDFTGSTSLTGTHTDVAAAPINSLI